MIYIYSIAYPTTTNKEDFVALFTMIDVEGIEEKEDIIDVYLSEEQSQDGENFIMDLCNTHQVAFTKSILEEKNWNEQWESSFQPILIDDFVYVRATFHPMKEQVLHEIIIEPKMSFGTGHHPTTSQMMQNMRGLDFKEKVVLDCGSGTGILSILAEKLGAKKITALDNDEWCYHNCIENISLNKSKNIKAEIGGIEKIENQSFDIILANIHRNFLIENMDALAGALNENGYLIVSGFYSADNNLVLDKALEHHLIANYQTTLHDWSSIIFSK